MKNNNTGFKFGNWKAIAKPQEDMWQFVASTFKGKVKGGMTDPDELRDYYFKALIDFGVSKGWSGRKIKDHMRRFGLPQVEHKIEFYQAMEMVQDEKD